MPTRTRLVCTTLAVCAWLLVACTAPDSTPPPSATGSGSGIGAPTPAPAAGEALRFWHTQTQDYEQALKDIVAEYNAQPGVMPVEATYIGNYDQLFEKVRAGLQSSDPAARPDLAVAYESMVAEYYAAGAVRDIEPFVNKPETGLDAASVADIYPAFLAMNRFPQYENKLLSFPFTKSVLMMYVNLDLLQAAGVNVPTTWDELYDAATKIRAKHPDMKPLSYFKDASALDAIFLSFGAELLKADGSAGFDSPAAVEALTYLDKLVSEKLIYEPTSKDLQTSDFVSGKCAFFFRSSNARPDLVEAVGDSFAWDATGLPHKVGVEPVTVLFGANIALFASTPEREEGAWQFIKYFASAEVTARWAAATGYLPVRASALATQTAKDYLAAAPQNQRALDIMGQAVPEPNVSGWQDVRRALDKAHMDVMNQLAAPTKIASELDTTADAALAAAKTP